MNDLHLPHELNVLSEYFSIKGSIGGKSKPFFSGVIVQMLTYKLQTSNLILLISHEVKNNRHAQSIKAKSDYIFSFFLVTCVVLHMPSKGKILLSCYGSVCFI